MRVAQRATLWRLVLGWGVIQGFRHKGLRRFFEAGTTAGIQAEQGRKLRLQLAALHSAGVVEDLDLPGYRLHQLKGADKGRWSYPDSVDRCQGFTVVSVRVAMNCCS